MSIQLSWVANKTCVIIITIYCIVKNKTLDTYRHSCNLFSPDTGRNKFIAYLMSFPKL